MNSLLSLVTFLPLIGAVVLMVFLRGEDELAQKNAKQGEITIMKRCR